MYVQQEHMHNMMHSFYVRKIIQFHHRILCSLADSLDSFFVLSVLR